MQVRDIMTIDPACCTTDTGLQEVAMLMVDYDCGAIPVVEEMAGRNPVGMVTDRDIAVRAVARGINPLTLAAGDIMSVGLVTVRPDDTMEECLAVMEEHQVRRVPVVDEDGACVGIVAQADVALQGSDDATGEVVEEISRPKPPESGGGFGR